MELISETSAKNDKVKWLVSINSWNDPEIKAIIDKHTTAIRLSLELNAQSVAGAVKVYINYKMTELAERYREVYGFRKDPGFHDKLQKLQDDVAEELRLRADRDLSLGGLGFQAN